MKPIILPAHPRSRGEHLQDGDFLFASFGSSPLARGTHSDEKKKFTKSRLIPARAGNTGR